jgi:outer membrane protein
MKKSIAGILVGIIIVITYQTAGAQNVKYGYINRDELIKSMPDYDSANFKVEKLRKEFETQLAGMQNELSSKTASLNNESANLSDFLRKTRQDELKNLDIRINLFQVKATQQLNDKNNELIQPVLAKADNAIKEVAKEQGLIFVLDGTQLLYSDDKKCTNILPLVRVKLGLK